MRNIILIGMPGSGKSSTAKIFAQKYFAKFFDTDKEIEKCAGQNISDIFSKYGEKYFREYENKILKQIIPDKNFIIATGGGILTFKKNLPLIKNLGLIIYLFAKPNQLYKNLLTDYKRPLIKKNLLAIKSLFAQRNLIYKTSCHFIFDCSPFSLNDIAEKLSILRCIK